MMRVCDWKMLWVELLLRYEWNNFKFIASYLKLEAINVYDTGLEREPLELTPKYYTGFNIMIREDHGSDELRGEMNYSGTQAPDKKSIEISDPY